MGTAVALDPGRPVLEQLRDRVAALEGGPSRLAVPTLPALDGVLSLRTGGSYGVDSASLALALAAGASRAGEWVGFAGWPDLGVEAAAAMGVELSRTVVVPEPGEHWLEVVAALVDVLRVVVLRPPSGVDARAAGVVDARLRSRSSVLVVWGEWPRCEARLSLEQPRWSGLGGADDLSAGHGRLRSREGRLAVRRGTTPTVRTDVRWWDDDEALTTLAPAATPRWAAQA
ncbi:hypothetical protein [Nocardioides marinquilinus]